jgi:hypothetical protein
MVVIAAEFSRFARRELIGIGRAATLFTTTLESVQVMQARSE